MNFECREEKTESFFKTVGNTLKQKFGSLSWGDAFGRYEHLSTLIFKIVN